MQHKLSDQWKNVCDRELSMMAEESGDTAIQKTISHVNGLGKGTGSIVSDLLRKASGLNDVSGGLEQKIQELRAEKEAGGKGFTGPNDQDCPLDFSVKRRSSFSGSVSDDSQGSSSSPGHMTDYTAMSPPTDSSPPTELSPANHTDRRATPSPIKQDDVKPDFPSLSSMPPLINGMSLFPGLPSAMGNNSAMSAFSQMAAAAAFLDPRNKKNNRPFKAYPKEALQMPLGFFGLPGIPTPGMKQEPAGDDLVSMYQQQVQYFRDKQTSGLSDKAVSQPPQPSKTSQILSQVSPASDSNTHSSTNSLSSNHSSSSPHSFNHQTLHQASQEKPHHPSSQHPQLPTSRLTASPQHSDLPGSPAYDSAASSSPPYPPSSLSSPHSTAHVTSTSSSHLAFSRKRPRSLPDEQKDAAYWERRRKNNDAAKRSRDARRAKEDEIAIRAALLEQENIKLRVEVAALKTETARLRCLLYQN